MENSKTFILKKVIIAYERWSFTGGSDYKALTAKYWCLDKWSLREVVAHGDSTVLCKGSNK